MNSKPLERMQIQTDQNSMYSGIKRCSTCRRTLPRTEYHKNKMRTDGLTNECKDCAGKRQNKLYRGNRRLKIRFGALSRRAERLGYPFHITFDEFYEWNKRLGSSDQQICPYCGISVTKSMAFQKLRGKKRVCGFTVDRINNERGYVLDNMQRICFLCNTIKGHWFTNQEMHTLGPYLWQIQRSALGLDEFELE